MLICFKSMAFYQIQRKQILPVSLDEAWEYFSSPLNLQEITPDYMAFKVTSQYSGKMYPGLIITYIVRPVAGIPLGWMTEITHVQEKKFFVDNQRSGPYTIWHHQHHFREVPGGVEMTDIINYKLPLGWLGILAHHLFVKKKLENIFDYRYQKLEKLFGSKIR